MKLAVVGATGMVGNVMLQVLEERNFNDTKKVIINTSNLSPGIYFVQLMGKKGVRNSKIIKLKLSKYS